MTKKLLEKNIKLSLEFDQYLNKHPDLYTKIPNGASVIITVKGDDEFNKNNRANVSDTSGKIVEAMKENRRWFVQGVPINLDV